MFKEIIKKIKKKLRKFILEDTEGNNNQLLGGFTSGNSKLTSEESSILENYVENKSIYENNESNVTEIYSVWDFLEFKLNTQAYYLTKVIGFEEWLTIDEIRRRILELFGVDFKHEKSLYPYIKTLVDAGLLENSSHGGKRKWRKRDLIIKITKKREKKEEKSLQIT